MRKVFTAGLIGLMLVFLSGCVTYGSMVTASPSFQPSIGLPPLHEQLQVAVVMHPQMADERARLLMSGGALYYDFEFSVGYDVMRTLPEFLSSLADVHVVSRVDEARSADFVLVPTVRSSITGLIKSSAAPRYDLQLTLESIVTRNGVMVDRIYVTDMDRIDIPAFQNKNHERTEYMRQQYENQLARLYTKFETQLLEIIRVHL